MIEVISEERKEDLEDTFASESSSLFQMIPQDNYHPGSTNMLTSVLQSSISNKRRRSWPPGSPKEQFSSEKHGIFVTCDDSSEDFVNDDKGFSNKGFMTNSFLHNEITATRSLAPRRIPKLRKVQRSHITQQQRHSTRPSQRRINNNVAERVSLFKALVHVDGENSSQGLGSEASRGIEDGVSIGGVDSGAGSYRQIDDMLMEGHSCGSVRALAVEAAFVANGILRAQRSAQQQGKNMAFR